MRIGIVAGEASGDLLGAGLIRALKRHLPHAQFEGIGGPRMQALGCRSLYPMDALTLIGLGSLGHILSILRIRRRLGRYFLDRPPDLFIGVDAPDFNLVLERRLRSGGVRTAHYVSPTVWAWRGYRIRKIRRAVDRMFVLFPFEVDYYRRHGVPVSFVGHPMGDEIPLRYDPRRYRRDLGLPEDGPLVALLPGSRRGELKRHAKLFVETAAWLHARHRELRFVAPFVDDETLILFERACATYAPGLPVTLFRHRSREVMAAADVVLLASGTAALEAALLRKPMVVTYKVSPLTYMLVRLFAHVDYYSMPNHLAGREIIPEFMQSQATVERLGPAIAGFLEQPGKARALRAELAKMHRDLRRNADARAAEAALGLLPESSRPAAATRRRAARGDRRARR